MQSGTWHGWVITSTTLPLLTALCATPTWCVPHTTPCRPLPSRWAPLGQQADREWSGGTHLTASKVLCIPRCVCVVCWGWRWSSLAMVESYWSEREHVMSGPVGKCGWQMDAHALFLPPSKPSHHANTSNSLPACLLVSVRFESHRPMCRPALCCAVCGAMR